MWRDVVAVIAIGKATAMKNMARDTGSGKVNGHEISKQGATSHGERQLVLVGDDEQAIREPIVQYLTDFGYDVVEASNGQEALKLLTSPEDQRPDIAGATPPVATWMTPHAPTGKTREERVVLDAPSRSSI